MSNRKTVEMVGSVLNTVLSTDQVADVIAALYLNICNCQTSSPAATVRDIMFDQLAFLNPGAVALVKDKI